MDRNSVYNNNRFTVFYYADHILFQDDKKLWFEWKEKQLNGYLASIIDPDSSCSTADNLAGQVFSKFLSNNFDLKTLRILDIGCGPLKVPNYLRGANLNMCVGLDPFPSKFGGNFIQGTAEYIPIPDQTFDLVIAASVVDHMFDVIRAVNEIRRVLKKNGKFVIWDHLKSPVKNLIGSKYKCNWYRIYNNGLIFKLNHKKDDPFHMTISRKKDWSTKLSGILESANFQLANHDSENNFSIWIKR